MVILKIIRNTEKRYGYPKRNDCKGLRLDVSYWGITIVLMTRKKPGKKMGRPHRIPGTEPGERSGISIGRINRTLYKQFADWLEHHIASGGEGRTRQEHVERAIEAYLRKHNWPVPYLKPQENEKSVQ